MIRPEGDGFRVSFGDGMTVRVTLTDSKIGRGGASLAPGLWVVVLEYAFEAREAYDAPNLPSMRNRPGFLRPDLAFTGHLFEPVRLIGDFRKAVPDSKVEVLAERLRQTISVAVANRRMMTTSTAHGPVPPSIVAGHCYALLGYEPSNDMVQVWNPWGDTTRPDRETDEGMEYGRSNGVFRLPLRDFLRIFDWANFETDHPIFEGKVPATIPRARKPE